MSEPSDELIRRVLIVVAQDPHSPYRHFAGEIDISATPDLVYVYRTLPSGSSMPVIVFGRKDNAVIDSAHPEVLHDATRILRQHQILDDVANA